MVESVLAGHNGTEHMVLPRLVYISDTTEIGTVYTKAELTALRRCCDEHGLYPVPGRRPAGLRPHLPGQRPDPAGSGRPHRRLHHRRHEKRRPLRGGAGAPPPPAPLPLAHEAAGRRAGQGAAAGRPVPDAAGGRPVLRPGPPRQRAGPPAPGRHGRPGISLPGGLPLQPAVPGAAQ